MLCLEGQEVVDELHRRTVATKVHGGASYRPRRTPSESEFKALYSQFTQRAALATVSGVAYAVRTRNMLRASQRPNENDAYGQAARRKVAGNSLPGRISGNAPSNCCMYEDAETPRRCSHRGVDVSDGGCSDTKFCAGTDGSVDDFAFPPRLAHRVDEPGLSLHQTRA